MRPESSSLPILRSCCMSMRGHPPHPRRRCFNCSQLDLIESSCSRRRRRRRRRRRTTLCRKHHLSRECERVNLYGGRYARGASSVRPPLTCAPSRDNSPRRGVGSSIGGEPIESIGKLAPRGHLRRAPPRKRGRKIKVDWQLHTALRQIRSGGAI